MVLSNHQAAESVQMQLSAPKDNSNNRTSKNASEFLEHFLERIDKTNKKPDRLQVKGAKTPPNDEKIDLKGRLALSRKGKSVSKALVSFNVKNKDGDLKSGGNKENSLLDDEALFEFVDDSAVITADFVHVLPTKAAALAGTASQAAEAGNHAIDSEKLVPEVNGKKGKFFPIRSVSLKKVSSVSRTQIENETAANKSEYKSGIKLELSENSNHGKTRQESREADRNFLIDTRTSAERNSEVVSDEAMKRTQNADVRESESADSRIRTFTFETKDLSSVLRNSNAPASSARNTVSFPSSIREPLNSEIVKQTGIILKSGDSGEIRLVLEPEQLGKVRIRIQLQQNRIAGRIIVDNINIKEAFEHDLEQLQRAFRENGFEVGNFNVAVGGQGQRENGFNRKDTSTANMMHVQELDDAVPLLQQVYRAESLVDLVV